MDNPFLLISSQINFAYRKFPLHVCSSLFASAAEDLTPSRLTAKNSRISSALSAVYSSTVTVSKFLSGLVTFWSALLETTNLIHLGNSPSELSSNSANSLFILLSDDLSSTSSSPSIRIYVNGLSPSIRYLRGSMIYLVKAFFSLFKSLAFSFSNTSSSRIL